MNVMKVENPPLDPEAVCQMHELWLTAFGHDFISDVPDDVLYGGEERWNYVNIYRHISERQTISTAIVIRPHALPALGGLGEVSTDPKFKGQGLATTTCEQLAEDFYKSGGIALFLGTVNPDAARIYERLGWQHINGSRLMVRLSDTNDYDEFTRRYFDNSIPSKICVAKPGSRIPLIPLVLLPHNWSILDSNISLYSTSVEPQQSCLGLYRRYEYLRTHRQGEWFTLITKDERVLGISSAIHKGDNRYQVDGFCHSDHENSFSKLIETAIDWCKSKKAAEITFKIAKQDKSKEHLIRNVGFKTMNAEDYLESDTMKTQSLLYSKI